MGILDLPREVLLMIFSYVPLYNILFSVQQTCRAWNDLCLHHYLWRDVHYSKEFDERLTKKKLLSVLKKVSRGVKHISFEKAFQSTENHFSFNKFLRCILHENVDMGNIASLKIPSIPYKYLEPLVKKCSGLSSIEIGYKYAYCNDGIFFHSLKRLPHLKEFRISKSAELVPLYFDEDFSQQTMFNEFLADMFSSLLELEVVHIDSANKLYDSTLCVLLSKCKNLRELALYGCICITNAGLESLPDKSGITSLHLISAGINDDGMEHICRSCPDLREVSFAGCMYVTDISIVHLCTDCPNLESLTVSDPDTAYHRSNITDDGLETLFQHYRSLRSLTLCNSGDILNLNVDLLANLLVRSCSSLTELDISGCESITDEKLRVIAVCCTNLERIRAMLREKLLKSSDKPSGDVILTTNHLVQGANVGTSTQYFDNTDYKPNEESHAGRSTTCSSIPSPRVHSELRVLNMGICSKLNDQCLRQIATYCPELRELNIKGCYNTTDDGISSIVRGCQRLRLLDISTSYTKQMLLSDRSLVSIATHCKNLRQLNILKNDLMSLDGVRYFCDRCPLPITVILTSRSHDIQRTDILSTDKSVNAFKMVKSNFFHDTYCFGNFHEVLLHNSNEDIFE